MQVTGPTIAQPFANTAVDSAISRHFVVLVRNELSPRVPSHPDTRGTSLPRDQTPAEDRGSSKVYAQRALSRCWRCDSRPGDRDHDSGAKCRSKDGRHYVPSGRRTRPSRRPRPCYVDLVPELPTSSHRGCCTGEPRYPRISTGSRCGWRRRRLRAILFRRRTRSARPLDRWLSRLRKLQTHG